MPPPVSVVATNRCYRWYHALVPPHTGQDSPGGSIQWCGASLHRLEKGMRPSPSSPPRSLGLGSASSPPGDEFSTTKRSFRASRISEDKVSPDSSASLVQADFSAWLQRKIRRVPSSFSVCTALPVCTDFCMYRPCMHSQGKSTVCTEKLYAQIALFGLKIGIALSLRAQGRSPAPPRVSLERAVCTDFRASVAVHTDFQTSRGSRNPSSTEW